MMHKTKTDKDMETLDKIYVCVNTPPIAISCSEVPFVNKNNNFVYIKKEKVLEKLRLVWGS